MIYRISDRYNTTLWLIIFALSSFLNTLAQETDIKFETYSTKHGLSQSSVVAVIQDEEGFMWFATYMGLNRFDGFNIEKYFHSDNKNNSIISNQLRALRQDTTGIIFIGSLNGLDKFFTHTGEFIHFKTDSSNINSLSGDQIYDILKDREGIIWIATWGGGLTKMEKIWSDSMDEKKAKYKFTRYTAHSGINSISSDYIPAIIEDQEGNLWIATRNGLNKFNKKTEKFMVFQNKISDPASLSSNNISSICIDKDGYIWVGTWDNGLNLLNPKTNEIRRFLNDPDNKYSLGFNMIMKLFCDKQGIVWVGTWGGGLNRVDKRITEQKQSFQNTVYRFYRYYHNKIDPSSIGSNLIYDIYQDRTGVIWVATEWGGVSKFIYSGQKFKHFYSEQSNINSLSNNIVYCFMKDIDDQLWIGTQEGLNKYNKATNTFEVIKKNPNNPNSLSNNQVISVIQTKNNLLWLGTAQGLNRYDPVNNKFKRYFIDPNDPGTSCFMKLYESRDGTIWLGTYNFGLYRFDQKQEHFEKINPIISNQTTSQNDVIYSITEDKNGIIWFGGAFQGGLYNYNPKTDEFKLFKHFENDTTSISNNSISSLFIDHNNILWIGTSNGINKLPLNSIEKPVFRKYFITGELSNTLITGIVEDKNNNLWISTLRGLIRFNPDNGAYKIFTVEEGLQDNEFSYNALMRDNKTNEIYAGGINGYNVFDPDNIISSGSMPVVKNVDLKIFNKSIVPREKFNKRIILDKIISATDKIELTYKENVFTIEYAALHFDSPKSNQYAYKLEGFDNDWNFVGNNRSATYTNLKPGKYIFKVKASNPEGLWSSNPTELKIIIKPPWWNTWLFKILLVLLILTLIIAIYRLRVRYLLARQKELEDIVRSRTEELNEANTLLEERQEEIMSQNDELIQHRNNLELLVDERTSELKAAKVKAEESDRLKSSFLANMSHEVRTPMNAIIGFSSLLDNENLKAEDKKRYISLVRRNGDTLLTLINDILDISLIEANQLKLNKENFCVDLILNELFSYYKLSNKKNISLEYINVDGNSKQFVFNDPIRFRQIMTNLISNALKYTEKGSVKFGYLIDNNEIEFFVEDTGIGISRQEQKNIFDYFYKIEESINKIYRGTGIGLSVCKKLITLMGSEIHIESELNVGSKFYFRLPISQDKTEGPLQRLTKATIKLNNMKIVIAEDEEDNFELLENILSKTDVEILWAKNGQEAVELTEQLLKRKSHFLILMDIKMPVMNGIEAMKIIKMNNINIPVIALTAYAQSTDRIDLLKQGFDEYIAKPIDSNHLINTIVTYANR